MSESTANEILIYTREDGTPAINVRLDDETIWVTQAQLVELFQSSKANISEHISNVFDEGELDQDAVVSAWKGDLYMLAAIILCGLGYAEGAKLSRTLGGWQVI
ncbi:MAG: hypothetical protein RR488_07935, partial [Aurantimicrobium sp.]